VESNMTTPCPRVKAGKLETIHAQLVADGYDFTKYALRQAALSGAVKSVMCGRNRKILYSSALAWANGGNAVEVVA